MEHTPQGKIVEMVRRKIPQQGTKPTDMTETAYGSYPPGISRYSGQVGKGFADSMRKLQKQGTPKLKSREKGVPANKGIPGSQAGFDQEVSPSMSKPAQDERLPVPKMMNVDPTRAPKPKPGIA